MSDEETKSFSYDPKYAISVEDFEGDIYPMDRRKTATAIIFNFKEFQDPVKHPTRIGTEKDVDRLQEVLKRFNIDVNDQRILHDMTHKQCLKELEKCKKIPVTSYLN